jgi:hypothetical protein
VILPHQVKADEELWQQQLKLGKDEKEKEEK